MMGLPLGLIVAVVVVAFILMNAIRILPEYERGVVFRLGRYKDMQGPGLYTVIPFVDQVRTVDTRVLAVNIPKQSS